MCLALTSGPSLCWADKPPAAADPAAKQAMDAQIRQYILEHPEVIIESLKAFQEKERLAQQQKAKEALSARQADLLNDPNAPSAGPADAKAVVVEFFDYRCQYCKKAVAAVMKLLADDPAVRIVFKEFPILGPDSLVGAKAALAAHKQGAYLKFHQALMGSTEPITTSAIEQLATQLGLDLARLKTDMEAPQTLKIISQNQELGTALGINGTPTFVVGAELAAGALDTAALQALIAKAQTAKTLPSTTK